jgi:hypothetical protein
MPTDAAVRVFRPQKRKRVLALTCHRNANPCFEYLPEPNENKFTLSLAFAEGACSNPYGGEKVRAI